MEPLPTQGQTLRHYTASRPRPRRTHTQPPSSRPQEPVSKVENEASEGMGRVDEGVEEFFTKKILPDYALKGRWEESNPAQATPPESSSTPSASTPLSSPSENITPCHLPPTTTAVTSPSVPFTDTSFTDAPPLSSSSTTPTPSSVTTTTAIPTKNIKKKFGDFFAFKRARAGRVSKAGGGEGGGGGEGVKVKRTSIADLIRPLREAKERERERDKEREKEREARSGEDANISNDAATTEGTVATSRHFVGDAKEAMAPANTLTTTTPPSETTPPLPAIGPDTIAASPSNLEAMVSGGPTSQITTPLSEQERSSVPAREMKLGGTPYGERRLKATKRSLREGKSQSLILLTGLEPETKDNAHSKKHASESTSSFEQRLQVMLHRMGVAKTTSADAKSNKDEELRKANSEGAILDQPEPPPTYMKPRTMSTSSADPRHLIRVQDPIRPDPPLHPKPSLPERPIGPLPPKPAIAAKPPLPTPAVPAGGGARPSSAPPSSRPESAVENGGEDSPQGAACAPSPRKEQLPLSPSPWRGASAQNRSEKAQSVTDESLPKPRQHVKPLQQRRAVSVHEDTLAMTQELKAVLQRSPIRFRGNRGDLPTCTEDPSSAEEAQRAQEATDSGKESAGDKKVQKEELKSQKVGGTIVEAKSPPLGEGDAPGSGCPSSTAQTQQRVLASRLFTPVAALNKASSPQERAPAQTPLLDKPPVTPSSQKKSPSTVPALVPTVDKLLVSLPLQDKTYSTTAAASESLENPNVSSVSHKKKSPDTAQTAMDLENSTEERGEALLQRHTAKAEPADQRTEPPLSE